MTQKLKVGDRVTHKNQDVEGTVVSTDCKVTTVKWDPKKYGLMTHVTEHISLVAPTEEVIKRDDGLTALEGAAMDHLVSAVEVFSKCSREHPDEMRDFVDGIHKAQDQLAVRVARRAYPDGWPTKS